MKKFSIILAALVVFSSCGTTSPFQDTQMLQKQYSTVYRVSTVRYICLDSVNVYDVRVTLDGQIESIVKIK